MKYGIFESRVEIKKLIMNMDWTRRNNQCYLLQ